MKNLEETLNEKVTSNSFLGGGSIADSQKIRTSSGKEYFVKSYSQSKSNILKNEVNGLIEIQKSKSIRTPQIIYYDDNILILEFIKSGRKNKNFSELLNNLGYSCDSLGDKDNQVINPYFMEVSDW
mgnify:CR=1 FL=1